MQESTKKASKKEGIPEESSRIAVESVRGDEDISKTEALGRMEQQQQQQQPSSISLLFSSSAQGAGALLKPALSTFLLPYLSIDTNFSSFRYGN